MATNANLLSILHQFQHQGYLCDTTLVSSDGAEFLVHAVVLAAASPKLGHAIAKQPHGPYRVEEALTKEQLQTFVQNIYTGHGFFSTTIPTINNEQSEGRLDVKSEDERQFTSKCSVYAEEIKDTDDLEHPNNVTDDIALPTEPAKFLLSTNHTSGDSEAEVIANEVASTPYYTYEMR